MTTVQSNQTASLQVSSSILSKYYNPCKYFSRVKTRLYVFIFQKKYWHKIPLTQLVLGVRMITSTPQQETTNLEPNMHFIEHVIVKSTALGRRATLWTHQLRVLLDLIASGCGTLRTITGLLIERQVMIYFWLYYLVAFKLYIIIK